MILLLPLLFILPSCDSGSDGGSDGGSNNCPIEGTWENTSFNYVFSDECTAGEDGSADLSCLDIIVADDIIIWDSCDCLDGGEPPACLDISNDGYSCDNPTTFDDGGSVVIDEDTATLIIIEPIEDFLFYSEGIDYGNGCMVTSTLVFERE